MRVKHRSLLAITLLTLLTFGVYHIYWYFITKTEMNVINGKDKKVPFFLWFFIPVVNIWWFWRFAGAIEKTTKGNVSRITAFMAPLILGYLGSLFVAIIYQPYSFTMLNNAPKLGSTLILVAVSLLPIYYFQSNLNKYAK